MANPVGVCRARWIENRTLYAYIDGMPGLIFWLLVAAAVVFFSVTTREDRAKMIETFWIIMMFLGALGVVLQLLRFGTVSF